MQGNIRSTSDQVNLNPIEFRFPTRENEEMRLGFLILILSFVSRANAQCPIEKLSSPITPQKLQSILQNPKIKKVEDLVCCLPDDYRNNYVAIHSGFAFQAGTPEHPRVLLYKTTAGKDGQLYLENAISVTGDDKKLNSSNHVEIMHNDNGKAELFDIDFDGSHQLSEANPKVCMGCHAPNPTDLKNAGAKVIFTDAPWPYAIGFVSDFGKRFDQENSETTKYFSKIENQSILSLKTQPRYACLDHQVDFAGSLRHFDEMSRNMNDRRVAALILSSPDYFYFRPLIIGAGLGCIDGSIFEPQGLERFEKNFAKWMPSDLAQKVFVEDRTLSANLRQSKNPRDTYEKFLSEAKDAELAAREKRAKQTDYTKPATFYPTSLSALFDDEIKFDLLRLPQVTGLKDYSPVAQLYARYEVDSKTQHQVGSGANPLFRLLFESRGISMITWSRAMAGGYGTDLTIPVLQLRPQNSDDAFWKEFGPKVAGLLRTPADSIGLAKKNLCDALAKQSFEIFSNESRLPASLSTLRPVQGKK